MAKWEHNLPAVLEPDGTISVCVNIPNHPDYVALFVRAVRILETQRQYQRDETMEGAKIVAAQFRDKTVTPLIQALADGIGCPDEFSECLSFPAYAGFIHYFPDNPYNDDEPIPAGYLMPAWWRWGAFETILPDFIDDWIETQIEEFTGYRKNDAICWISSLLSLNIPSWLDSGYAYPAIEIELEGSGEIEIILVSMPLGGRVFIEVDEQPNIIDIITGGVIDTGLDVLDTNRDWSSFPPEEYPELRYKVAIPEDGEHTVYVMFLPVVNATISDDALGFGGGLRGVELCGGLRPRGIPEPPPPPPLDGVEELKPEFRFTDDCGLEYQLRDQEDNIVQEWQVVAGWVENAAACFAGGAMTAQDFRDGIYQAVNDLAAQLKSGSIGGFTVGDDGTVTFPSSAGDSSLPEDNPLTPLIDERLSAKMGGIIDIARGLESVWDKIDALFGVPSGAVTPVTSLDDAKLQMQLYFACDQTLMGIACDNYYAWRLGSATQIAFTQTATFAQFLFCNGYDANALARWVIDNSGWIPSKQIIALDFWLSLSESFFSVRFANGIEKPSTTYLEAVCVPSPQEIIILNVFNTNVTSATSWKPNHRLKFSITGVLTDTAAGHKRDFWWYDGAAAAPAFVPASMSMQLGTGITKPTINQVPFSATGTYVFTIDTPASSGALVLNMAAGGVFNSPFTGSIDITIDDLGEIAT